MRGWEGWVCPWCMSMMPVWPLVRTRQSSLGGSSLDCCTIEGRFRKSFGESQSPKVSTVLPLLCSVIGQVQPIGSAPLAQTLGWISEVAAQLCSLSLEAFLLASVNTFPLGVEFLLPVFKRPTLNVFSSRKLFLERNSQHVRWWAHCLQWSFPNLCLVNFWYTYLNPCHLKN